MELFDFVGIIGERSNESLMEYEDKDLLDLYTIKDEEHWYTLFNPLIAYLGDIEGKKILDIGCGSGALANELSKKACQVVGLDSSEGWIGHCKKTYDRENLRFFRATADDLSLFADESFDIVVMNMVVPNIYDADEIRRIFGEIRRVVKETGDIVFSDLHPVCVMAHEEGNRKQVRPDDFSYFKDGNRFTAVVKIEGDREIAFSDSHWTLGFYTDVLDGNGIYIKKIIESTYPENAPKKFFRYSYPEYIIFCCKKF